MEKEFDFKNIGKQMPYRTPDGFFDRMQEQVSARTKVEKHKKQLRMRLVIAATLAAASFVDNRFCGYCHSCGIGRLSVYAVSFQGR